MIEWHQSLVRAKSHPEIVAIANDYLASWTPREVAELPQHCRPSRIKDVSDLEYWMTTLSEACCSRTTSEREQAALVQMLAFLFSANDRAKEVGASPQDFEFGLSAATVTRAG